MDDRGTHVGNRAPISQGFREVVEERRGFFRHDELDPSSAAAFEAIAVSSIVVIPAVHPGHPEYFHGCYRRFRGWTTDLTDLPASRLDTHGVKRRTVPRSVFDR